MAQAQHVLSARTTDPGFGCSGSCALHRAARRPTQVPQFKQFPTASGNTLLKDRIPICLEQERLRFKSCEGAQQQVNLTRCRPMEDRLQVKLDAHAALPWLQVSDSVSSMKALNMATAAKDEVPDEDQDQAKALSRLRQSSAHKGTASQAASSSLNSKEIQRLVKQAEVAPCPGMRRWVCSMYRLPPCQKDHCSRASLGVANSIMQACTLPGLEHGSFLVVSGNSLLYHLGISWGFTAMTIALGSSYFQRLCHTVPSLEWAAQRHVNFAAYACPRRTDCDDDLGPFYGNSPEYQSRELTLQSVLFTCVSIASKNVDRVQHPGILQYMLSQIYGVPVTAEHVYDVESKCLDGLNWQLGPYYVDDALESSWVAWIPG